MDEWKLLDLLVYFGKYLLDLFLGQAKLRRLRHGKNHSRRHSFRHDHQRIAGDTGQVLVQHSTSLSLQSNQPAPGLALHSTTAPRSNPIYSAMGSVTWNALPLLSSLSTQMRPP
jgi:hypothetical protein